MVENKIEENFEGINISGIHIEKGKDELMVYLLPLNGLDERKRENHKKYIGYNLVKSIDKSILIIEDYFNGVYGWYLKSGDKNIDHIISRYITKFYKCNNYKVLSIYGSSKGGYGALNIGLQNKVVSKIYLAIPIIDVYYYYQRFKNKEKCTYFSNYKDYIFKIGKEISNKKNIFMITGINDWQFDLQNKIISYFLRYSDYYDVNLILDYNNLEHGDYMRKNVDLIKSMLKDEIDCKFQLIHSADKKRMGID